MAFMGMMFAGTALIILCAITMLLIFSAIAFLILGFVFRKKKKTLSNVFFIISGISAAPLACALVSFVSAMISVPKSEYSELSLKQAVEASDIEAADRILDKEPELIRKLDHNSLSVLEHALKKGDIEMVKCLLEHGAEFDDPTVFDNLIFSYSFELFFSDLDSEPMCEISDMVSLMIENGAQVEFSDKRIAPNALFYAEYYIFRDDAISSDDVRIIQLLIDGGASVSEVNNSGENALDCFKECAEESGLDSSDEGYDEIVSLLSKR